MPHSKNSLLRYKTIDSCLCNRRRKWTLQDLIKACEQALHDSGKIMKQLTGFTDMAGTEDIISRLDDRLESLKTQQKPVLYPEQDNLPNGRQYIPIIHQAIVEKSVLAIRYKSSREYEPRTYIISRLMPYANSAIGGSYSGSTANPTPWYRLPWIRYCR